MKLHPLLKDSSPPCTKEFLKEDSSSPYTKEFLKEDSSPPYTKEFLKEDSSSPYTKEFLKEDSSPPYTKEFLKEDSSPPYTKEFLKEDSSPSYTKEFLKEDSSPSLDTKRVSYVKIIGNSKLTSGFDLKLRFHLRLMCKGALCPCVDMNSYISTVASLPPKGNILDPCKWGWMKDDDELKPVFTSKPPIPEKLAEMISYNCKSGCGKRCGCRRVGNECSVLCTHYIGVECLNCPKPIDDYDSI